MNDSHKKYVLIFFFLVYAFNCIAQKTDEERRLERFYLSFTNGIIFPVTGEFKGMKTGYNFIAKGGWHWRLSSRGGLSWSLSYSYGHSKIPRTSDIYIGPYYTSDEFLKLSIRRYDFSLLDPFRSFGKNGEGYFHVAVDLVFNQNTFEYNGHDYTSNGYLNKDVIYKGKTEVGIGTQYGLHIPVSDHFGIGIDAALLLIQLKNESTNYITYSRNTTTSNGIYGYANIGLVYGIW